MKSELLKKWKEKLGRELNTIRSWEGEEALTIRIFKNGFLLKRANRGEIVLDRFDLMCLKDIITKFEKREDIFKAL